MALFLVYRAGSYYGLLFFNDWISIKEIIVLYFTDKANGSIILLIKSILCTCIA